MSIRQMVKVWEHEFDHAEQSVMMALADHAHDDGTEIRPGVDLIAWKTGYERRQVQRILKSLRDNSKILVVQRQGGGRGNPTVYRFDWSAATAKPEYVRPSSRPPKGDNTTPIKEEEKGDTPDVKGDISEEKGDTATSPEPSLEPSDEEPNTPTGATSSVAAVPDPPVEVEVEEDPAVARDAWNRKASATLTAELAEKLAQADVPYMRGWRGRHGKGFLEALRQDVAFDTLQKAIERIVERWTGAEHAKLEVDQALADVVNGRPPRHARRDGEARPPASKEAQAARRREGYEWLFEGGDKGATG